MLTLSQHFAFQKSVTKKFQFDADAVRQLAQILTETSLTEIEYENEGCRIYVARQHQISAHVPSLPITTQPAIPSVSLEAPNFKNHQGVMKSPMVGTAYLAAEPGANPFVRIGDAVTEGQTVLILEAMKVMNPIKAPASGKVIHIFVSDAKPVEYGEPLLVIE